METYIKKACEQFEALLREQLARSEKMKENVRILMECDKFWVDYSILLFMYRKLN